MPRRLTGILIALLVSVSMGRAQGDIVLMTVGNDTVSRSEYLYYFRGTLEKRPDVFARTLACFKQKVQMARELGLDTAVAYRRELEHIRDLLEQQYRLAESGESHASSAREWVKLVHVTCPLPQHADKRQTRQAQHVMDSLYVSLTEGRGDVRLETMPWVQTRHLPDEWKTQLKALDKGMYSKPFYSPQGIHIIAWTDKREGGAERRPDDLRFRRKEMEEGLLVASLERRLEEDVVCTEAELEDYFREHRADFGGGTPHYRGAVIHCQSKKEAQRIKKYLKKYPEPLWAEAAGRMPADVSEGCRIETGLFPIGSNPYVDKLVFRCGDFEALTDYPYTWVLGKKLKKGPTAYTDVREKVENDCKKFKKKAKTATLIGKYKVEIDEEVLKTVNHEGNQ